MYSDQMIVIHKHQFDLNWQFRKLLGSLLGLPKRLKDLSIFFLKSGNRAKPQPEPSPGASVVSHFNHQEWAKVRQEVDSPQRVECVCAYIRVCSVCNLTLPDSSREKDIHCCCFPFSAFLPPLDVWHQKGEARGGGGGRRRDEPDCFMPNWLPRCSLPVTNQIHSSRHLEKKSPMQTFGLLCLLSEPPSNQAAPLSGLRANRSWPSSEVKAALYFWVQWMMMRPHCSFVPSVRGWGS